jgi:cholesterol transport system auxiliary component
MKPSPASTLVSFARRGALLSGLAMMTGCAAGLLPEAAERPDLFVLTPKSTFADPLPRVRTQLAIDLPVAPAGIDSGRIALMHTPLKLDYYARSNWIDRAPAMVQALIIETFESTDSIVGVGRVSVNLRADFVLATELREFQVEYFHQGKGPVAHAKINAKLVRYPERAIVGNLTTERMIEASADSMDAIIPAFDEALGKTLREIVVWTLTLMAEDSL